MKKISITLLSSMAILFIVSCEKQNWEHNTPAQGPAAAAPCDTNHVISYATEIVPIMNASCGAQDNNCHSAAIGSGNTVLDQWLGVNYCAGNTTNSSAGLLMSCIIWDGHSSPMPKSGSKLAPCEILKIQKWVKAGAPDN